MQLLMPYGETMNKVYKSALPGERFGRLVVTAVIDGQTRKCLCDCGTETVVLRCNLKTVNTQSCGCFRKEIEPVASITHGQTCGKKWSPTYRVWHGMLQRCLNPKTPRWGDYGGRGITVCAEWQASFDAFLSDMGERPDGCSIDRIDNDGPYHKANCVWANDTQQARNKRSNRLLTYNGKTQTLAAWAEETSIPYYTLHSRLRRGWTLEKTLSEGIDHV